LNNLKILIVDDTPANLISLEYLLNEYFDNIDILKAVNGEEALKVAFASKINLIILDIQMPVMDGFETALFLKKNKKTKEIPIIFLTAAFKEEEFTKKGFEVGAVDYLTKPINNNQLINKLKLYIELFKKNLELLENHQILMNQSKLAAMGEMIGNIAHQWRQPLSVISTSATGIIMQKEVGILNDEKLLFACNSINDNAQYLSRTIDDFKNFIKGDSKKENFSLKKNINNMLNLVAPTLKQNRIELILDIEDCTLNSYPNELNQCLINIINNAKDALESIDEDKFVFIKTTVINNNIEISIRDNANGISNDIINKIFEPYFTTKHQSQGTGLGLSMTYKLITEHIKGKVIVKNNTYEYNNKTYIGANFIITLTCI